jgi:hypothetical protein
MPSINIQSLTPRIVELVTAGAQVRSEVGSLTSTELDLFTAAARGDRALGVPLSRDRALGVLAAAARPEDALPVLELVARDPTMGQTDRVAALRGLGRIATRAAQDALLGHVHDPDPRVQQAAFAALGEFADASALATLADVSESGDVASRRQLTLARALIVHREGRDGPFLPELEASHRVPPASERLSTVTLTMKSVEAANADLTRFRGPTYGIRLSERAYELRCGRAEWTLFGNQDLGGPIEATDQLMQRAWIIGLLARWLPPGIAATTQYVVLSRPTQAPIRVDVVRTDGELAYTGTAAPVGSALSFSIRDVDRPGTAPTNLSGLLSPDGVQLQTAVVSSTRVAPRRPEPIGPDAIDWLR